MPDGPSEPLAADTADATAPAGPGAPRDRIEALIAAARDLSDTCADLADELRPDAGSDGSAADRAAALLDEAALAVRTTLGLLAAALDQVPGDQVPDEQPPDEQPGRAGGRVEPDPTVAIPAQVAAVQDPFSAPSPWAAPEPLRAAREDPHEILPPPHSVPTTWPDAFSESPSRSVAEEDLIAASRMDRYDGAEIGAHLDRDEHGGLAAVPAALAGWVVVDDEAGGEPVALEHRPTGPIPAIPAPPPVVAAAAGPTTMLTVSTDDPYEARFGNRDPYADRADRDPYDRDPYGEAASPEPRSLTLVPPLPNGAEPQEQAAEPQERPEHHPDPVSELPPPPVELPEVPTEPQQPPPVGLAPDPWAPEPTRTDAPDAWAPEPPRTAAPDPWAPEPTQAAAPDPRDPEPRSAAPDPWVPEPARNADDGWSVWAVEPVPGSSPFGEGVPVYPLDEPDLPADPPGAALPMTPAEAVLPPQPVDDPSAAVVARQVEAARRHLQAALVVANRGDKLGALLTAVEQALTAVTDLARETRGVLPEFLSDRTFPGEARFLCSGPWQTVELVGREAYGDEAATPAGLAKLLRALGYDAESITSASGVNGVQIRDELYAAHVALVEPAGGGRQRWSGALEWSDAGGASRTWAETLGPVELAEDELARRVDELLRRSVGS